MKFTSEAQTKKSIALARYLLRIFDRFLSLRHFGEICMEAQAFLVRKTYKPQQN
jgi:hypothetical protein